MDNDKTRISADQGDHYVALPPGFVLGKYELRGVLGQGGFGITYKAWDTGLNRAVAIKEYLPAEVAIRLDGTTVTARSRNDADHFQWGLQRFLDEARALARFEDAPSVVRVHDYLQANGTAYMVMALIDGTPLQAILRREAPLSEARLKAIALPLLEGLQHVHQAGFLHRDIKPSNILIRPNGQPALIDFGAARQSLGERSHSLTSIFTPGYAPFEQYSSTGRQGPWTDLYALAATLYHGVSGKLPVSATDRIPDDPMVPAVRAGAGRYSRNFLAAIDHGLGVFEAERPQDAMQWARMLREEIPVPPPRVKTKERSAGGAPPRRRVALVAGGVALASVAVVGIGIAALPAGMLADIAPFLSSETPQQRAQRLAEQARLAAVEAQRAQAVVEAEAKRRADEEARLRAEVEARQKAEAEAKQQAAAAQRRIEEADRARDDDARRRAEAEVARLAEEQRARQRLIDEQVAARAAAEEARKKAEADLAEVQRQAIDAQKQAAALRQQAAAAQAAADAEAQRRAEAEARAKADAKAKAEADAKAKTEADAKAKADAEARRKAEADAKAKAEAEAKRKAEADAKAKADAEAKRKVEADARAKADQEARSSTQAAVAPPAPQIEAPQPMTSADIRAAMAAAPTQRAAVAPPPPAPTPPAAPAVAAVPGFAYAGHWGWVIDCPNFTPVDGAHFLDSAILIEGPTFSSGFSWNGKSSGRFSGNSMSIQFTFTARNGRIYQGSLGMSVRSEKEMRGGGLISGFDMGVVGLGGAASAERQCSSVMIKKS